MNRLNRITIDPMVLLVAGNSKATLLVAIGNCTNRDLVQHVIRARKTVSVTLLEPGMVEIRKDCLIITPLEKCTTQASFQ